eukprot:gene13019-3526_t
MRSRGAPGELQELLNKLPPGEDFEEHSADELDQTIAGGGAASLLDNIGTDPLRGAVADIYTIDEFVRMTSSLFVEAHENHKLAFFQLVFVSLAAMTNMHQSLLRSEDLRLIKFSHLMKPSNRQVAYHAMDLPPMHVFANALIGAQVTKGKRSLVNYRTRHVDYKLCAVNSLARMLFFRLTVAKRKLPDPSKDLKKFLDSNIWSMGGGDAEAISCQALARSLGSLIEAHDICISKSCDAYRAGGAQWADNFGLDMPGIKHWGDCNLGLATECPTAFPELGVKAMAGIPVTDQGARYEQERLHFQVPVALLKELVPGLYPWVASLEEQVGKVKKRDKDCPARVLLHLKGLAHTLLVDIAYSTVVNPLETFEDGVVKPLVHTLKCIRSAKVIKTAVVSSQPLGCPSSPRREPTLAGDVVVQYKLPLVKELDPHDPSSLKNFSLPEDFFTRLSVESAWVKFNKALMVGGVWMSMPGLDALWAAQVRGKKTWYSGSNSRRKEVVDLAECISSYTGSLGVQKTEEEALAEFFKWTRDNGIVSLSQWNMRMRGSVRAKVLQTLKQGILTKDLPTQDVQQASLSQQQPSLHPGWIEQPGGQPPQHRHLGGLQSPPRAGQAATHASVLSPISKRIHAQCSSIGRAKHEVLNKIVNLSCKSTMAVFYNEVFLRDNPSKQKYGMTHEAVVSAYKAYQGDPDKAAQLNQAVALCQKWTTIARNMLKDDGEEVVAWKKGRKRPTGSELFDWNLPQ